MQLIQRLKVLIHEGSLLELHPDRTMVSSFDFLPLRNGLWQQRLCESDMWLWDEVVNFGTADVSEVRTRSAHHLANRSNKDVTKPLSCVAFYVLRIYFLTHWLPPKTATVKFSP